MNRKLKAMGLALFAAFALSAIGAQAASADLFEPEQNDTVLTAEDDVVENESGELEGEHEFTYGIGTVKCKVTNFSGIGDQEDTEINITPTYDECEFLEEPAVVRTNHCYYVFTSQTDENGDAPVHVECGSEHIEIEVPNLGGCTVTVAAQSGIGGVAYTNQGSGSEADVTVDITAEVEAKRDNPGSNFFCSLLPSSGTGEYNGKSTLKGYELDGEVPSTANEQITWTADTEAITEGVGTTHWSWNHKVDEMKNPIQVGISVKDTP